MRDDTLLKNYHSLQSHERTTVDPVLVEAMEAVGMRDEGGSCCGGVRKQFFVVPKVVRLSRPVVCQVDGIVLPVRTESLQTRFDKVGLEDRIDSQITEQYFPIRLDAGPRKLVWVSFGINVENVDVDRWANANDFGLATNEDLLAVGANFEQHSRYNHYSTLVQLGSMADIDGMLWVTCLQMTPVILRGLRPSLRLANGSWTTGVCEWKTGVSFLLVDLL